MINIVILYLIKHIKKIYSYRNKKIIIIYEFQKNFHYEINTFGITSRYLIINKGSNGIILFLFR